MSHSPTMRPEFLHTDTGASKIKGPPRFNYLLGREQFKHLCPPQPSEKHLFKMHRSTLASITDYWILLEFTHLAEEKAHNFFFIFFKYVCATYM